MRPAVNLDTEQVQRPEANPAVQQATPTAPPEVVAPPLPYHALYNPTLNTTVNLDTEQMQRPEANPAVQQATPTAPPEVVAPPLPYHALYNPTLNTAYPPQVPCLRVSFTVYTSLV
jgi:hypothetical protein